MTQKWISIAPIRCLWEAPQTLPFYLGDGVSIALVPDKFKIDDSNDVLRERLIEAIDDAEYCFLVEYEADALDEHQPEAELKICYAYMALWLIKGTEMYIDWVGHIHEVENDFVTRRVGDLDRFYCAVHARDAVLTASDFADSVVMFKAVSELPTATTLYTALRFIVRGLKEYEWEWRFISLWVAMEALFGANTEINFRLSQRVALFLGKTSDEAKAIARATKESYGFRSKVVHGSIIKDFGNSESLAVMEDLEQQLRQALNKILADQNLVQTFQGKGRDAYLDELVYSKVFD